MQMNGVGEKSEALVVENLVAKWIRDNRNGL